MSFEWDLEQLKGALSDLFLPPACGICDGTEEVEPHSFLCRACRSLVLEVEPPMCLTCGLPVPGVAFSDAGICGRCMKTPPPYGRTRYGLYYQGPVRDALLRFKYSGGLYASRPLARLLVEAFARHFDPDEFDVIVPVPVHRSRLISRGFNQVVILSERLARKTGIPLDRRSLVKTRRTIPQVGLEREKRLKNLSGSFGISRADRVKNRRVLLVDDVATTGATIAEASKALLKGRAARVDALVLCMSTGLHSQFAAAAPHAARADQTPP